MKPRSSVISVIASLIILFACFTQIGVTAYIGNVSPTLDRSSRYESSYVVEKTNSTFYQATNGTSGAVEFLSSNASYVYNSAISNLPDGGLVIGKAGNYVFTASIVALSNVVLEGEGEGTVFSTASSTIPVIRADGIASAFKQSITVRNLKIVGSQHGTGSLANAVRFTYCNNSVVQNVWVQDFGGAGLAARYSKNILFEGNHVYRNGWNPASGGVQIYFLNVNNSKIIKNWVWDAVNTTGGIELDYNTINGYGNTVSDNYVSGNSGYGMRIKNNQCTVSRNNLQYDKLTGAGNLFEMSILGNNSLVSDNWVHCNVAGAYVIDTGSTTDFSQFLNNHIWGGTYSLRINTGADNCQVANFYSYNSLGAGIVTSANKLAINNAYIYDCGGNGIQAYASQDLVLRDDYVYSAGAYSVSIAGNSLRFSMDGCTLDGGVSHGVYLSGVDSYFRITNNIIKNHATGGKYAIYVNNTIAQHGLIEGNDLSIGNAAKLYDGATDTIVKSNLGLVSPSDGSAFSYIVSKVGSNYYAVNGSSGLVEFGPSNNASYIWQQTVKSSGSVFWKNGLFNFPTRITIPDNISITVQGEGMNCTLFKYTGAATGAFLTVGHVWQCTLRDLGFDASNVTSHVLNWTGANPGPLIKPNIGGIIDSCYFTDSSNNYGVVLHRWYDDANNPVQFLHNKITMCPGALRVASGDNSIEGNGFSRNGKIGSETGFGFADLRLDTSGTNKVIGNYLGGRAAWGLYINSAYNIIIGNQIDRHSNESIYVNYVEGNIISNNELTQGSVDASNTYAAIKLTGWVCQNNTISGNHISQRTETDRIKYGIYEYNKAYRNIIEGNFIENYGTAPMFLNASTYIGLNYLNGLPTQRGVILNNVANNTWVSHGLPDFSTKSSIFIQLGCNYNYNATGTIVKTVNVFIAGTNSTKFLIWGNNATYSGYAWCIYNP